MPIRFVDKIGATYYRLWLHPPPLNMKEKIKEFVHRRNYVSFMELTRAIPGSAGERSIRGDNDSLVLWEGVSVEFAEAVQQLLCHGEIAMTTCDPMVYFMDGCPIPKLPVAKKIKEYPKAHWLPVTLCRPKQSPLP